MSRRVFDPQCGLTFVGWVEAIVDDIDAEGYNFKVHPDRDGAKIQADYFERDVRTFQFETQFTRKWLISPHACESEIVRTCFKCIATSMEHRAREGFKWKGARIFGPHIDIYALLEASRKVDVRDENATQ
jgi:hypothetical protein